MLTISQYQYDHFLQSNPQRFILLIYKHIAETMPDEIRGIPERLVCKMISTAIKRARSHGLGTDGDITGFVCVMFEVAPNFDEEPVLRSMLESNRSPTDRWNSIFFDTAELNAAWERAGEIGFYDPNAWIDSGNV